MSNVERVVEPIINLFQRIATEYEDDNSAVSPLKPFVYLQFSMTTIPRSRLPWSWTRQTGCITFNAGTVMTMRKWKVGKCWLCFNFILFFFLAPSEGLPLHWKTFDISKKKLCWLPKSLQYSALRSQLLLPEATKRSRYFPLLGKFNLWEF